ncbi:TetR/AcrR family transcriptional regulator [Mycobacterium sp. C31M]
MFDELDAESVDALGEGRRMRGHMRIHRGRAAQEWRPRCYFDNAPFQLVDKNLAGGRARSRPGLARSIISSVLGVRRRVMVSASGASRVYGGMTGEDRVAERRRKLIDAGMNLFGSADASSVRVKDVVIEAGLTERYFYESFRDLDALFNAVLELTMDTIERDVELAVLRSPDNGLSRVSGGLRTSVDTLAADPRMIRIIFVEALGKGGRAGSGRHEILVRAARNFLRWSGVEGSDFGGSSVQSRMKAYAMSGAASALLVTWAEGLLDIAPQELADFLVGLYQRTALP